MPCTELVSHSPAETQAFAQRIGERCQGGEILLLMGDLGAGKTCFVQGLAQGLGIDPATPVVSPTFVIHARYFGHLVLDHIDAYRLEGALDLVELGLEEIFASPGVTAIEWPERLAATHPERFICFTLTVETPQSRRIVMSPSADGQGDYERFAALFPASGQAPRAPSDSIS